jgi:hypothetical protein
MVPDSIAKRIDNKAITPRVGSGARWGAALI